MTDARSLRQLSVQQWKTGIAAWLGWFFDGLELHLYTLVAAPFVMQLLGASSLADRTVLTKSSWIQASFLIGWAVGGSFFGHIGDRLGRARTLALTVLTYAAFTGLSFFAHTWWQLLLFRFVAALGIGGEWAVGAALLSETWPRAWRPWIAAVLQCGVNLGILLACGAVFTITRAQHHLEEWFGAWLPQGWAIYPRCVFLVGIVPALLVFWLRRNVPETSEWTAARASTEVPGVGSLFAMGSRRITLLTVLMCATSLTGWWAFMFWHPQHLRNLRELASWSPIDREQFVIRVFFLVVGISILGNFFAGWLARAMGYRRAIAIMFLGAALSLAGAHLGEHPHSQLVIWYASTGFFSGVFGLFTMYLPPLFPTLLRTTGAGFCYNIGRIAAAFGTVYFGLYARIGDFQQTLLLSGLLFVPAMIAALLMPEVPVD